jgi:hypothetical protein
MVQYVLLETAWIDKNADNMDEYPPNFCMNELYYQVYQHLDIFGKRK